MNWGFRSVISRFPFNSNGKLFGEAPEQRWHLPPCMHTAVISIGRDESVTAQTLEAYDFILIMICGLRLK